MLGWHVAETQRVIRNHIEASLPKPKSPEQVIHDVLLDPFYPETAAQRACQVRDALKSEGWLRDTPEKT